MNKLSIFSIISLFSLISTGCTTAGGGLLNTNTVEDAGNMPLNYESSIMNYLERNLKDPYSVKGLRISKPVLTQCAVGMYGPFNGWRVTASYNAKNSYGAYTGLQEEFYWFHGEQIKGVGDSPNFCPEASGWK